MPLLGVLCYHLCVRGGGDRSDSETRCFHSLRRRTDDFSGATPYRKRWSNDNHENSRLQGDRRRLAVRRRVSAVREKERAVARLVLHARRRMGRGRQERTDALRAPVRPAFGRRRSRRLHPVPALYWRRDVSFAGRRLRGRAAVFCRTRGGISL